MNSRKIRIGLFSFAHFHQNHWVTVFSRDPRVEVVGIWDSDEGRLRDVSARYDLPSFHREKELLEQCDAAAICSETCDHERLLSLCCEAGVNVLCEKPAAVDLRRTESMKEIIARSGILYYQSFPQRHIESNREIKRLLESGSLGTITHVRKRHGHYFGLQGLEHQMPWIVDPEKAGGGAFLDEGIHEADLLRWFFGDPLSVSADLSFTGAYPVETAGAAVYKFPGDILCVLECAWNWPAAGPTTEIYGDRGVLVQNLTDCASNSGGGLTPHLSIFDTKVREWRDTGIPWDFSTIHTYAPKDFIDILANGGTPASGIEDAVKAAEMIEGAYRSFRERKSVSFRPTGEAS